LITQSQFYGVEVDDDVGVDVGVVGRVAAGHEVLAQNSEDFIILEDTMACPPPPVRENMT
jgi:hypothetical protein